MKIHILQTKLTEKQLRDTLEALGTYIKVAVDVERGLLAGGGEYHADCEGVLLENSREGPAGRCLGRRLVSGLA